jgi:phospholipase/carboxylesterase
MADYIFREQPGAGQDAPLLLVFHGTGGDENQFFELGEQLVPGARVIAPRGDVSEGGALRYFRRTGEGRYDMEDLARRTDAMAEFVAGLRERGAPRRVMGLGYSNGANILASVMFQAPGLFDAAALLHPLIPFTPAPVDLTGRQVLISAGRRDPIAPATATDALAAFFATAGATTELVWHEGGHELRPEELAAAQRLFARAA